MLALLPVERVVDDGYRAAIVEKHVSDMRTYETRTACN